MKALFTRHELKQLYKFNKLKFLIPVRSIQSQEAVRVRFAPSPTGFLHIGGLRTALYNFLFAKKHNGKFILRIEDTDQSRFIPNSVDNLLSSLKWVGIVPDESSVHGGSHGPYIQSERLHHYNKFANQLVESGAAYQCFCSQQRLALLKKGQKTRKEQTRYDNRCRHLSKDKVQQQMEMGIPYVIRLKLPEETEFIEDMLHGKVGYNISQLEGDPVLLKTDGFPTYHLANVVDDHLMQISHVIRGQEWLTSTVKHTIMYKYFGWNPPQYLHLPLFVNPDGSKLSKRQGDVFVEQYRNKGYSPATMLNFIASHGSAFPDLTDKFPIGNDNYEEVLKILIQRFSPSEIIHSDVRMNFSKLEEFGRVLTERKITNAHPEQLAKLVKDVYNKVIKNYGDNCVINPQSLDEKSQKYIETLLDVRKGHITRILDITDDEYKYLWVRTDTENLPAQTEFLQALEKVEKLLEESNLESDLVSVMKELRNLSKLQDLNFGKLMQFLRMILIDRKEGPSIVDIITMLGKNETVHRLKSAKLYLSGTCNSRDKR
uniref:Nondiscriminating glutamyl-tRNA synthetase EARS2, mitochondrial n=1 Tax=Phallusia mammillata TaxID=59560 RepID=A0A6F9DCA6_9ASCI|nr:probable glutamate--tRNA ligase, mitochondrial [Phallusia mammillata]